ncbi:uncharacterized protein DUF1127 [Rhizobium subbaraonis]|uniref:Uncharacterized protein DUF1127 n=1 Tax=Rhizobium subbaraonis TaxID=908946 RepID=A0A285TZN1_9HYPH|nr:DUF1127 domain-containing protein [Rhizobium subbaraonis]SOC34917.1 uncharacterized protein DUF1127 [Rhizobium subbaraonis]
MRTIDSRIDLDIAAARGSAPSLPSRLFQFAVRAMRTWRNRAAVNRLHDLDDWQLRDIGLERSDVKDALTSTFFADPGLHLTIASRERAQRYLRNGRRD